MTDTIPPVPIMCVCGNQIYEEVYVEGHVLVHAGGGLWHELRGHCCQCGAPFNWSVKSRQIQRAIVARKKIIPAEGEK
ncbi:MAG: hypothetical protein ABSG01_09025 [Anaerolineales bacterium]|jgi:hypothetical protein